MLGFTRYVEGLPEEFLLAYLDSLKALHPDYRGLCLANKSAHMSPSDILNTFVRESPDGQGTPEWTFKRPYDIRVDCGRVEWHLQLSHFSISGGACDSSGNPQKIREAYGDETTFIDRFAGPWIRQGICDELIMVPNGFPTRSNTWAAYIHFKDQSRRMSVDRYLDLLENCDKQLSHYSGFACNGYQHLNFITYCEALRTDHRVKAQDALRLLRDAIEREYSRGAKYSYEATDETAELKSAANEIDAYLLDCLGRNQIENAVGCLGFTIDEWLQLDYETPFPADQLAVFVKMPDRPART